MARRKPVKGALLQKALDMMGDEKSHRAAALVTHCLLDNELALTIMRRMRCLNGDAEEAIFKSEGPLGYLSQKIPVAYALGILGPTAKDDLGRINTIRNRFAHEWEVDSFEHVRVRALCHNLRGPTAYAEKNSFLEIKDMRRRFLLGATLIVEDLRKVRAQPKRTKIFHSQTYAIHDALRGPPPAKQSAQIPAGHSRMTPAAATPAVGGRALSASRRIVRRRTP